MQEAHEDGEIPYAYRTFAKHYRDYAMKYKATMRIRRKPGELLEVDWAGTTLSVLDADTGKNVSVYIYSNTTMLVQWGTDPFFQVIQMVAQMKCIVNSFCLVTIIYDTAPPS